jgi:hypothetical protein
MAQSSFVQTTIFCDSTELFEQFAEHETTPCTLTVKIVRRFSALKKQIPNRASAVQEPREAHETFYPPTGPLIVIHSVGERVPKLTLTMTVESYGDVRFDRNQC